MAKNSRMMKLMSSEDSTFEFVAEICPTTDNILSESLRPTGFMMLNMSGSIT